MAGRITPATHATVTAATNTGYLTVTSSAGLYVGGRGFLSLTDGTLGIYVEITDIVTTTVGVRKVPFKGDAPNYGRTDVSAYNGGGFLDQEAGFVYNRNDAPAP